MRLKTQICMVLNLDKCIGCHTCSVTCKNVWTTRRGVEYAWFNNVETKPGPGYPINWENQKQYEGGWILRKKRLHLLQGGRIKELTHIFFNPHLPSMADYYEPFSFNYSLLRSNKHFRTPPSARPYSLITGNRMEKIHYGPNWEDNLGGTFAKRSTDPNLEDIDTAGMEAFERTFMYYLPRLCEHCLNPACVASCPSGALYKREEDGIVLIDEMRCRGWRQCVSACPYKKIYFNWATKKSEKCIFCYPRIESGQPTVCSESCVGRIRYIGVILYDEDQIATYAATENSADLHQAQLKLFLDPNDPTIQAEAIRQGISQPVLNAAIASPVYKLMKEWEIALPLHPEFRTLPMVWYIPPLSAIVHNNPRIPLQYLANMLAAGNTKPVERSLRILTALRAYMRAITVDKIPHPPVDETLGISAEQYDAMYHLLAIAPYEERFVIPTARNVGNTSNEV